MTFSARQTYADLALEPFPVEDLAGQPRELPNLQAIPSGLVGSLYDGNMFEVIDALLEDGDFDVDPGVGPAIKAMPIGVLVKLGEAWLEHSGMKPGESQASSPSSASTARPSKPTSRSGGSKTRKR